MLNPPDSVSHSTDGEVELDFPDEILVEILSRLPAIDLVRLRSVCKRWRDLTCSQNLTLLHLRRSLPMVLFHEYGFDDDSEFWWSDHYLLDSWWERLQTPPKVYQFGKVSKIRPLFSDGGLVVLENYRDYTIMNPMYHEKVRVAFSEEFRRIDLYGVFFHPSLEEYCTLWGLTVSGDFTEYKILTLESKPCLRDINNPWSHIARIWCKPPVFIDENLYWVVTPEAGYTVGMILPADIMEFDIRKEEFIFISSPVTGPYTFTEYDINLFDIGGFLSLVQNCPEDPQVKDRFEVNIWTLKDHARKLWTMSNYRINKYPFFSYPRPMALLNDELVVYDCRQLFSCNLKLGTLRELEGKRYNVYFLSTHVMSLVSLRNCKSEIHLDKWGVMISE